jgi:ubiquinone/menaquinone biosynthesis C-methylase UbiE
MLAVAQRRLAGHPRPLSLQRGDAECLPFETGRFDGVTCMRLYQRVPADVRVQMLREVRRVGNGWAIVSFAMSSRWLDVRRTIRSRVLSSRSIVPHPVTFQELEQDLRAAGLRLEAQTWVLPGLAEGKVLLVTW